MNLCGWNLDKLISLIPPLQQMILQKSVRSTKSRRIFTSDSYSSSYEVTYLWSTIPLASTFIISASGNGMPLDSPQLWSGLSLRILWLGLTRSAMALDLTTAEKNKSLTAKSTNHPRTETKERPSARLYAPGLSDWLLWHDAACDWPRRQAQSPWRGRVGAERFKSPPFPTSKGCSRRVIGRS